jgi:DNA-binding CsgD family transcriptional regulator
MLRPRPAIEPSSTVSQESSVSFGWSALTPTERAVVELAATGCTNAEIGARLLMGSATVKTHLTRVYTKLAVRNRAELAALVADQSTAP